MKQGDQLGSPATPSGRNGFHRLAFELLASSTALFTLVTVAGGNPGNSDFPSYPYNDRGQLTDCDSKFMQCTPNNGFSANCVAGAGQFEGCGNGEAVVYNFVKRRCQVVRPTRFIVVNPNQKTHRPIEVIVCSWVEVVQGQP
jgi:hypothetical protein